MCFDRLVFDLFHQFFRIAFDDSRKNIRVRDRATLFNLIIGLNGYTVCSGVISAELNGRNIISKPLDVEEYMRIGIISRKGVVLSRYAREYIEALKAHCM